jgi:dolichol-phosphate mannosyltransferase
LIIEFIEKEFESVLIIPILNEGQRIIAQLNEISKLKDRDFDIVIVDGNSNDGSIDKISTVYNKIIRAILIVPETRGLSHQLRFGFNYCLQNEYMFFMTMDGNNKDGVEGIKRINEKLKEGFDFIQGSRFIDLDGSINTPVYRELAIKYIHAPIVSFFSGKKFTDTTNGFRGFSRLLLENNEINIFRDVFCKYELIPYISIRVGQLNLKSCEVPVIRRYPVNSKIPTKIHGLNAHMELMACLILSGLGYYNPSSFKFLKKFIA